MQLDFFDRLGEELMCRKSPSGTDGATCESEQEKQLRRVSGRIANLVQLFFDQRRIGEEFHMAELTAHVLSYDPETAPDSPRRVMNELRRAGEINYELVNRRQSLYRITRVNA